MSPGEFVYEARQRHGVSQKQLAIRASTTQSAISRIERSKVSPSVETLRELLYFLGEDLELRAVPRDSGIDATLIDQQLRRSPTERLDYGMAFANMVIANSPNPRRQAYDG
jgi:transcriptional regulator with XRE-family HTH domain